MHCVMEDLHTNNGKCVENDAHEQASTAEVEGARMNNACT